MMTIQSQTEETIAPSSIFNFGRRPHRKDYRLPEEYQHVMATHGRTGVVRAIFGATAEEVVRSGLALIYLVHPEEAHKRSET